MQKFGQTLITDAGKAMLTAVDGAQGRIIYTKAILSSQDVSTLGDDKVRALTALSDDKLDTAINVITVQTDTVTVGASFNNATVTQDILFNSIGWYAKTTVDNVEHLLAVTPSLAEQTLIASTNGASSASVDIELAMARGHNTTVTVSPVAVGLIDNTQLQSAVNTAHDDLAAQIATKANSNDMTSALAEKSDKTALSDLSTEVNTNQNDIGALKNTVNWKTVDSVNADSVTYTSKLFITNVSGVPTDSGGSWGFLVTDRGHDNPYNRVTQEWWADGANHGVATKHYYRQMTYDNQSWSPWIAQATQNDIDSINNKVSTLGAVKTINGTAPDSNGNVGVPLYAENVVLNSYVPIKTYKGNNYYPIKLLIGPALDNKKVTIQLTAHVTRINLQASGNTNVALKTDYTGVWHTLLNQPGYDGINLTSAGTVTFQQTITWGAVRTDGTSPQNDVVFGLFNADFDADFWLKIAVWKDDTTPPDMTWLPAVADFYSLNAQLQALQAKVDAMK